VLSADGSGTPERITNSIYMQWPYSWSVDGKTLVYVERHAESGYDIWGVSLDDPRSAAPLLRTPVNENNPVVSEDGGWIAYQSNESGQYEIYIQPFPEFDRRCQVSRDGGNQATWAPDGKTLYFRHGTELLSVDFEAGPTPTIGTPQVLLEDDSIIPGSEARNYDISRDGSKFLVFKSVEKAEGSAANRELIVVENWFEVLKQAAPIQ